MAAATEHAIYPSLRGKTVIVTGGAEGIGAATVELFSRQGSRVVIFDIAESSARKVIDHIKSISDEAKAAGKTTVIIPTFYQCDVSNLDQLQSTAQKVISEHGTVHVLINNAALTSERARVDTMHMTPETWEFNFNVNLRPVFFLTQAVIPTMKAAGGGSIVNLGSITWRIPASGIPAYTAAKAAVMGLTRSHSKEFGPSNIRVNSVMPGAIATERQIRDILTPEYRAEVMQNQSLQRDLVPIEVAKVIVFLASDEASAVTGSSYVVDGGWCSDP